MEPRTHWTGSWVAPGPIWTFWRKKNTFVPTGIRTPHRPLRSPLNRIISGKAKLRNSPENQASASVRSPNAPNFTLNLILNPPPNVTAIRRSVRNTRQKGHQLCVPAESVTATRRWNERSHFRVLTRNGPSGPDIWSESSEPGPNLNIFCAIRPRLSQWRTLMNGTTQGWYSPHPILHANEDNKTQD
jgi:hypothetical protein